ncbi:MAG: 50S ribosomal protein L23 [Flavobacteriaceae bacterium]|jgi:large subunit ribosomal protein L23|nr:50S ribosomal protein L23 [Bacteroidota bacterium]MDT8414859.1 50S ribosomal protein L23 [Flavobacteriaceae bacterium]
MSIIVKPIISEKANADSEVHNRYTFEVEKTSNKIQIKEAVEKAYGVSVVSVRTLNVRPDRKSRYTKSGLINGKTKAYKKAVVTLAEGNNIDYYSNI